MTVAGSPESLKLRKRSSQSQKKPERKSHRVAFCVLRVKTNSPRMKTASPSVAERSGGAVAYLSWCQCISIPGSAQAAAVPLKWAPLHRLQLPPSLCKKTPTVKWFFSTLRANYIKSLCSDLIVPAPPSLNQLFNRQPHCRTARAWGVLEWAYSTPRTPIISRAPCSQSCGCSARQMQRLFYYSTRMHACTGARALVCMWHVQRVYLLFVCLSFS